jgi:AcrR family transcriptional regulator
MSARQSKQRAAKPSQRRSQQERRETTRAQLLTAALEQLLELGLRGFTTNEVCRRAGLSQGALFKHFATKAELLAEVIQHLFDELRTDFEAAVSALSPKSRTPRRCVALLWKQMLDPRLAAAFELYTAARTDEHLHAALQPVVAAHVARIHVLAVQLFPTASAKQLHATVELAILAMQGLVLNQMALTDTGQRQRLTKLLDTIAPIMLGGK